jgi:hypothetical protein
MDMRKLSNSGLTTLHNAIHDALKTDDETPPDVDKPFGVRQFADWRDWGQWLETELTARKLSFVPVRWW